MSLLISWSQVGISEFTDLFLLIQGLFLIFIIALCIIIKEPLFVVLSQDNIARISFSCKFASGAFTRFGDQYSFGDQCFSLKKKAKFRWLRNLVVPKSFHKNFNPTIIVSCFFLGYLNGSYRKRNWYVFITLYPPVLVNFDKSEKVILNLVMENSESK